MNPNEIREMMLRHLGQVEEIELETKDGTIDKFKMSSLSVEKVPEVYELMSVLKGADVDPTVAMENITKEWLDKLTNLAVPCLMEPLGSIDIDESNELEKQFKELVVRHAMQFFNHICQQNLKVGGDTDIDKVKARINASKTALAGKAKTGSEK